MAAGHGELAPNCQKCPQPSVGAAPPSPTGAAPPTPAVIAELPALLDAADVRCGEIGAENDALRDGLASAQAGAAAMREVLTTIAVDNGAAHEEGCPEDSTCDCRATCAGVPVAKVEAALATGAGKALLAERDALRIEVDAALDECRAMQDRLTRAVEGSVALRERAKGMVVLRELVRIMDEALGRSICDCPRCAGAFVAPDYACPTAAARAQLARAQLATSMGHTNVERAERDALMRAAQIDALRYVDRYLGRYIDPVVANAGLVPPLVRIPPAVTEAAYYVRNHVQAAIARLARGEPLESTTPLDTFIRQADEDSVPDPDYGV